MVTCSSINKNKIPIDFTPNPLRRHTRGRRGKPVTEGCTDEQTLFDLTQVQLDSHSLRIARRKETVARSERSFHRAYTERGAKGGDYSKSLKGAERRQAVAANARRRRVSARTEGQSKKLVAFMKEMSTPERASKLTEHKEKKQVAAVDVNHCVAKFRRTGDLPALTIDLLIANRSSATCVAHFDRMIKAMRNVVNTDPSAKAPRQTGPKGKGPARAGISNSRHAAQSKKRLLREGVEPHPGPESTSKSGKGAKKPGQPFRKALPIPEACLCPNSGQVTLGERVRIKGKVVLVCKQCPSCLFKCNGTMGTHPGPARSDVLEKSFGVFEVFVAPKPKVAAVSNGSPSTPVVKKQTGIVIGGGECSGSAGKAPVPEEVPKGTSDVEEEVAADDNATNPPVDGAAVGDPPASSDVKDDSEEAEVMPILDGYKITPTDCNTIAAILGIKPIKTEHSEMLLRSRVENRIIPNRGVVRVNADVKIGKVTFHVCRVHPLIPVLALIGMMLCISPLMMAITDPANVDVVKGLPKLLSDRYLIKQVEKTNPGLMYFAGSKAVGWLSVVADFFGDMLSYIQKIPALFKRFFCWSGRQIAGSFKGPEEKKSTKLNKEQIREDAEYAYYWFMEHARNCWELLQVIVWVCLAYKAYHACWVEDEVGYRHAWWPWYISLKKVYYCPHAVSSVVTEYNSGTNAVVVASTVNQKLLRLGALPLPDAIVLQIHKGTELVVASTIANSSYFDVGLEEQLGQPVPSTYTLRTSRRMF